ncbi:MULTISPECIES: ATP-binding protein [Thiorhodovibrio]|uniref:ATP-binding protein n=1 Tax=Thiorhodovibrio TaxID=61593 RepID=UPI00191383A2|nr:MULTISPECIES: ATP-binding protein [Thiorhodovibrio]MBK5967272.1 tRNA 2-thiocytidine(32) synthetase TtcA [Thiorhodovibrio winogradskyi]WPL14474.1 tRNA 2-thiocytidine biosynthesis protein TtcA [Thiorhodovibrio litoralis]
MSKNPDAPPKSLLRLVGRAIADYRMIQPGDRVLVAVSGGKDSLSLLQILRHLQRRAPVRFSLGVITVDPEVPGFDPQPLTGYYATLDLNWHFERQPLMEQAEQHMQGDSFCAYCARMKRGIMYRLCREHGYNVLALGQHLDDLAESLMMSMFHGGQLRTMKAHYRIDAGDLRVIRPLAYCRERQTRDYAEAAALPVVLDSCPACFEKPTQREYFKTLLAREEASNPRLFGNLLTAMRPLLTEGDIDNL